MPNIQKVIFVLLASSLGLLAPLLGQVQAPCGLDYGTVQDRENIQNQMLNGSILDVVSAIDQAKASRGLALGCPQVDYGPYTLADTAMPSLQSVESLWNTLYRPFIENYSPNCPEIGRGMPSLGLAALYATLAGIFPHPDSLDGMALMVEAQQYSSAHAPDPLVAPAGIFGYYADTGACQLSGVAGTGTQAFCAAYPQYCVMYDAGLFAGSPFLVRDHVISGNQIQGDIGGAGFDQGWSTAFLIENAVQQQDTLLATTFRESAFLSGSWSAGHPSVANHNYTAKLIWLLAQLYEWSGDTVIKSALIEKLDRNLVPGVLSDWNQDGEVDGVIGVRLDSLHPVAQVPGRMWDGHNSLPWYHSMNAWAMVEAYCAFRDRGEAVLAAKYKPYALSMIDNLAHELVHLGVPQGTVAWTDIPWSILTAIWKIDQYEASISHPLWYQSAAAIWNEIFANANSVDSRGINIPLYALILKEIPYQPLHSRAPLPVSLEESQGKLKVEIWPSPAKDLVNVRVPGGFHPIASLGLVSLGGKEYPLQWTEVDGRLEFSVTGLAAGVYLLRIKNQTQQVFGRFQIVK